jgi:Nuclease-related domain
VTSTPRASDQTAQARAVTVTARWDNPGVPRSAVPLARRGGLYAAGRSSLDEWKLERRARSRRLAFVVAPLLLVALAVVAYWVAGRLGLAGNLGLAQPPPGPNWPVLGIALGVGGAALLLWPRQDPSRWARGAAGELATADLLEHLPGRHWVVLHDLALPGSRANVDHLVIGPTGVWVVDTKAYRARLEVRWRSVLVGSVPLSTAAVRWEAERVSGMLGVEARPIVAVHGRGLPGRGKRCGGVRVVPATRLVRRLGRGRRLRPSLTARRVEELSDLAEDRFFARAASG